MRRFFSTLLLLNFFDVVVIAQDRVKVDFEKGTHIELNRDKPSKPDRPDKGAPGRAAGSEGNSKPQTNSVPKNTAVKPSAQPEPSNASTYTIEGLREVRKAKFIAGILKAYAKYQKWGELFDAPSDVAGFAVHTYNLFQSLNTQDWIEFNDLMVNVDNGEKMMISKVAELTKLELTFEIEKRNRENRDAKTLYKELEFWEKLDHTCWQPNRKAKKPKDFRGL